MDRKRDVGQLHIDLLFQNVSRIFVAVLSRNVRISSSKARDEVSGNRKSEMRFIRVLFLDDSSLGFNETHSGLLKELQGVCHHVLVNSGQNIEEVVHAVVSDKETPFQKLKEKERTYSMVKSM